jgi:hypothetical protein
MNIVIKNNQKYKRCKDRLRRLCNLEKCNYPCLSNGYCKKHNIKDNEKICKSCLFVKDEIDFIKDDKLDNCKKCINKIERKSPDYKSVIIIKNGNRYKIFPNSGCRKLCKLETCTAVASGDFCRKHKSQSIKDNEKKCSRCLTIKSLTEFKKNNIEYKSCINCRKYKQKMALIRHQDRRKFILQIKIDMGGECIDCKTNDLEVLEFDHITDDKIKEIRRIHNYKGMIIEAKKTQLRCANCHFIKTKATVVNEQVDIENNKKSTTFSRKYREHAKNYVNNIKINSNGCLDCNWFDINNLQVLQFDHIDEKTKEHNISRLVNTGRSLKFIQKEIDKCKILCANCHRKRTLRQFNYPILEIINSK